MKQPSWEDIQALTSIAKKLDDDEASMIYSALVEWSYNYGYAKGILETLKAMNEAKFNLSLEKIRGENE